MKIILLLKAPHYLRPFAATVRELASRGHEVQVAWYVEAEKGLGEFHETFADCPGVTFTSVRGKRSVDRREVATIRRAWNYLRYLDQPYRGASKLRTRAFSKFLRLLFEKRSRVDSAWGETGLALTPREVRRLRAVLEYMERLIPTDPACDEVLRRERPDALLMSPVVDLNSSSQADFAKSARALGIPFGMLVYSWDNLSTKGGLHVMPDRVFVWNQRQRREAMTLHGVPRERVVMTGAPRFDAFLACTAQLDRTRYCESLGLDPSKPVVTYVCSSAFVSGRELPFVEQWLAALRRSDVPALRGANVVVRPHPDIPLVSLEEPATKPEWNIEGVVAAVRRPFDDRAAIVLNTSSVTPQGLFECLFHTDAVVGLNTSAEIEAGILGKPVLSILADERLADGVVDGQRSTLHFHYLLKQYGGFVTVAPSLEEHVAALEAVLTGPPDPALHKAAMRFVRPHDATIPAYRLLADAVERELLCLAAVRENVTTP